MAELKEILLGERLYWRGTQEISLLLPSPGSPDREIALSVLHMDDSSYERYWSERRSSGKAGHAPAAVSSTGVALSLVSGTPGAIAIVPAADVRDSVKVVKIDGRLPSDSAYPIH